MSANARRHQLLATSCGALVGLAVLTLAVRSRQLLIGEFWVATHLSALNTGVIGWGAVTLDEVLNDWGAPVVFAAILGPVLWRWGPVALFWYCAAGVSTVVTKFGDLAQRPRPTPDLQWGVYLPGYGGYPSGHVVYVVVLAGTLALLARRYEPSPNVRRAITGAAIVLSVLIGPARIVTNDHWTADVVGGYLFATLVLSTGLLMATLVGDRLERLTRSMVLGVRTSTASTLGSEQRG